MRLQALTTQIEEFLANVAANQSSAQFAVTGFELSRHIRGDFQLLSFLWIQFQIRIVEKANVFTKRFQLAMPNDHFAVKAAN